MISYIKHRRCSFSINLNTGFEGLCPPGLGLHRYAEFAGVFMEILPRLLSGSDSHVTSLVMVVRAESNNGFDLLWRVLELTVPGFDPSLQFWLQYGSGRIYSTSACHMSCIFVYRPRKDSSMMRGPKASHFSRPSMNRHMWTLLPHFRHISTPLPVSTGFWVSSSQPLYDGFSIADEQECSGLGPGRSPSSCAPVSMGPGWMAPVDS
jgi:hypothetical protein